MSDADVLLPALAGHFGDRGAAVTVAGQSCSWAELAAAAGATAERIAGAAALAVAAESSLPTLVAVAAGLLAGVPVVPFPPGSGPTERRHILADSGAEVVAGCDVPGLPRVDADPHARSGVRIPEPPPASTALIVYTSGTTGLPKGVSISRRAVAANLDALAAVWDWTAEDTLAHGLPLYHVHGLVLGVLGALRTGSTLVHTGRPTPAAYAAAVADPGATLLFGVPTIWSRVVDDSAATRAMAPARLLVSGSAALPARVFTGLAAGSGQYPVERYGMTETLITLSTRAGEPRTPGTVGRPLPGLATRVVDGDGRELPRDGTAMGELQVSGRTVFGGYRNLPAASAAALTTDGWFRTGDVATVDPQGCHRIVGRLSVDLIESGGHRIGAGEVEDVLLDHPGVREAAVVGRPHADLGEEIVAYVVVDGTGPQQVLDHAATQLAAHKRPRQVHVVDALPRNAMGKVVKQALRES